MCGIIAILRKGQPQRQRAETLEADSKAAFGAIHAALSHSIDELENPETIATLESVASALGPVVAAVRTPAGIAALLDEQSIAQLLQEQSAACATLCDQVEELLDRSEGSATGLRGRDLERVNAALIEIRDGLWNISRDGLVALQAVQRLLARAGARHLPAVTAALSIHQALSALDRLEVRGRDSAGLHLLCSGHGVDPASPSVTELLLERRSPLFENRSVRFANAPGSEPLLSLTVKVAEEIGELGDNVRSLRRDLEKDEFLAMALRSEELQVGVLGHTRWASVGLITEANAHPLNQERLARSDEALASQMGEPYVVGALNGDVDNYADLKSAAGLCFEDEITTDAKVIPSLIALRMNEGANLERAFQETVASFVGSVAIGVQSAVAPNKVLLALHGSGQALYVGLAEDAFIVASEPYGIVELCDRFVRLDGETPGNPDNPSGSRGQVMIVDGDRAGCLEGLQLHSYDGTELPLTEDDVRTAEITTRDVDRGDFPHYLLKEITEAPRSFEKTLRGRVVKDGDGYRVQLGPSVIPEEVRARLASGEIQRILVIGQGTAAVAGRGVAAAISRLVANHLREVRALPATELSGFGLTASMDDTLVVAISQSGTTTDTNRTVDLVRARGAAVLAIVNRRQSDLCDKADGVLFTSDGRDIEMSVASTKAFYSQIAAGFLMAVGLAERVLENQRFEASEANEGAESDARAALARQVADLLVALKALPDALRRTLQLRPEIDEIAKRLAPPERYWALVGNGLNLVAAEEIRIKLSELCYKSIACDATEDKKHIDLSSEPLILVCAAGLEGSTADDVAKEVAIYRAHKAVPVVIASEGEQRFNSATAVIRVPRVHPALDFIVASLVGHLFGYSAALAIDAQARPLREVRHAIEGLAHRWIEEGDRAEIFGSLLGAAQAPMKRFLDEVEKGAYNGHLEASTATELSLLLRTVMGQIPLDGYAAIFGGPASPASVIESLSIALTQGIDELTRPVDAIKHQAKTVTVGISRSDEALLTVPLVAEVLTSGADRDRVAYSDLRTLAMLDPVVAKVLGYTRYGIEGDPASDTGVIRKLEAGGLAKDLESRTVHKPELRGTKRRVALDRRLLVARGSADGRLFILVPEVSHGRTQGLLLMHVQLQEQAPLSVLRGVLQGYRGRFEQLKDAVMETEETFREDRLNDLTVEELLVEPVDKLAQHWRRR